MERPDHEPGATWPSRRETRRFDLGVYDVSSAPAEEPEGSVAS
ncbi:hypothetical protein [Nocardia thraciensis]